MTKPIDIEQMKKTGAIINLKGSSFVTFKGLLWVAHQNGLQSLTTELISYDPETNMAIVQAVLTGTRGGDKLMKFSDLGDASPKNVGKLMVSCIIRMASTRAKARVLRDFLGIGICSLEELPSNDDR